MLWLFCFVFCCDYYSVAGFCCVVLLCFGALLRFLFCGCVSILPFCVAEFFLLWLFSYCLLYCVCFVVAVCGCVACFLSYYPTLHYTYLFIHSFSLRSIPSSVCSFIRLHIYPFICPSIHPLLHPSLFFLSTSSFFHLCMLLSTHLSNVH